MGTPTPEPQRIFRPPRRRTKSQRSRSSNEQAHDGSGPLAQTSVVRPGSSHDAFAVQDSSFSGRGPPRRFEHGEGNPLSASPDLQVNCCSTSSGGRTQYRSRWASLLRRSKRCDARGSACNSSPGCHPGRIHRQVRPIRSPKEITTATPLPYHRRRRGSSIATADPL
jgi:hypothetical protein